MSRYDLTNFSGAWSSRCCPTSREGCRASTTVGRWTAFSGCCDPAHLGVICRSATGRAPPATTASRDGGRPAYGTGWWTPSPPRITATSRWSTALPFAPTSRLRRKKGGQITVSVDHAGGLTTKTHVVLDAQGLSIRVSLTAG